MLRSGATGDEKMSGRTKRDGLLTLKSFLGKPISKKSVLDGLSM
jgi:hypothetical protein